VALCDAEPFRSPTFLDGTAPGVYAQSMPARDLRISFGRPSTRQRGFLLGHARGIMRVPRVLTSLVLGFMASSAVAGSMWLQLDPRNVNSQPLTFKIMTERSPQGGVLFYVDVESKKAVLSRNLAASLTVTSGKQLIARVDVKEKEYGSGVRFLFEVSAKYLGHSKFAFKDVGGRENPWLNDVYWFFLKDFASEK